MENYAEIMKDWYKPTRNGALARKLLMQDHPFFKKKKTRT